MRCIRNILMACMMVLAHSVGAQNISVSSFKLLENDLTANTTGTMERDQNGAVAALIKVVTTEQGFVFDGGMTGIVKTKQGVGEIWVYVPHGIKKITIQHPHLGVLRDYWFPISIEKARTYEMVLTTGKVETVVTHAINKQFVVFEVTPPYASIELDNELLSVDAEGHAEKNMPFGKYQYRASAHNYHTEAGIVEVNDPTNKHIVKITLRPNFGWLQIIENENLGGADIYIDNEKIGKAPLKSEALRSGMYKLKIVKPLYYPYEGDIEIKDNQIAEVDVKLQPNFAPITLVAVDDAEIYVDGQQKGISTWTGPLEKGSYTVEVRKVGHRNSSIVIYVTTTEERSIQLPAPQPILSAVEITSHPSSATVFMDGKEIGTTPLLLPNVLIGKHELTFAKRNYQTVTEVIEVKENETAKLNVELSGECRVSVNSNPVGAFVCVDGGVKGQTPITLDLYAGEYIFRISKPKYVPLEQKVVIDGTRESFDFTLKRRYIYPDALYLEGGLSVLDMGNAYGSIGFFIKNFSAEFSCAYGLQHSEPIYWNSGEEYYEKCYTPQSVTGKFGYGLTCGNRVRITPQVGCSVTTLMESKDDGPMILDGANILSGILSLRCEVMLGAHIGLNVSPQYMFPIWKSPWAEALSELSPMIDGWGSGFGVKAGVLFYF